MSGIKQLLEQSFPPRSLFSVNQIPDLSGKVVIVTGGNAGIGRETVQHLLEHNAKVYIASRSADRAQDAIHELKSVTGKTALFLKVDLADLKSVKAAAAEFLSHEKELHILINNGGVMKTPLPLLTADGYDLQFGTNVLGHFYFTKLLLPTIESTAATSTDFKPRIVNLTSGAHYTGKLDYKTFKGGASRTAALSPWYKPELFSSWVLYCQSKYGNLLFSQELARRYEAKGIVSIAVHPGSIRTDLWKNINILERAFVYFGLHDVQHGALTSLFAATMPQATVFNGKYLAPWAREAVPKDNNPQKAKELWTWLDDQVSSV